MPAFLLKKTRTAHWSQIRDYDSGGQKKNANQMSEKKKQNEANHLVL